MNNNKGYSLTELLLAMFILSIVMLGIAGILRSTSMFYRNGVQEVRVQEEAQLAVNLIEEMLVDAKGDVEWLPTQERLNFKDENSQPISITLVENVSDPTQPGKLLMGYFDDESHYVTEELADYVTGFEVSGIDDPTAGNGDNRVVVAVSMDNSGYEYTASKEVYFRNLIENPTISINTVPSGGGGGGGSAWDYEIELNRYDSYNLTTWCKANPSVATVDIGSFDAYFDKVVGTDDIVVKVDPSYNVDLNAQVTSEVGLQFTDIDGNVKKIRFYFQPVSVFVSPNADVFVYSANNSMNGQGYCTVVEAKGIDINKCLQQSGATVTAKLTLNGEEKSYTLKAQTGTSSIDNGSNEGKQEFNNGTNGKLLLNIISDTASNGLIIGAGNGGDPSLYNGGQSGTLKVDIKIAPAGGQTPYTNTLNYKFRIAGNVL